MKCQSCHKNLADYKFETGDIVMKLCLLCLGDAVWDVVKYNRNSCFKWVNSSTLRTY